MRNRYRAIICCVLALCFCLTVFWAPALAAPQPSTTPAADQAADDPADTADLSESEAAQKAAADDPADTADLSESEAAQKAAADELKRIQEESTARPLREPDPGTGLVRYLFETDQAMTMPKNSVSYYFLVPASITLSGPCQIKLYLTYSQTIIHEFSSLTLSVNGTPVAARAIVEEGVYFFAWDVEFDSSLINIGGFNEIKLTSVQRSIEGECADIDNPSNWVVLHRDSYLRIGIEPAANPPLSDFIQLYYDALAEQFTIANDYILGDTKDADMISAMLGAASAAGLHQPGKSFLRFGVFSKSAPPSDNHNRIYIEKSAAPSAPPSFDEPDPMLADGEGYAAIAGVSNAEPYYKLLVGGKDAEGLKKATAYISNQTLLAQTHTDSIRIKSPIPSDVRAEKFARPEVIESLADLGYPDIKLAGVFHQSATLSFTQPNGIRSATGSYVDLHFRHAAALISDRSQITVSINGTQMDSTKLTPGNAQGGTIRVYFPESALDQPVINVDIEVYHYLGQVDCVKDFYDVAWTVIDAQKSELLFKRGQTGLRATLKSFPYFGTEGANAQVSIVLAPESLQTAAMLAARAGQNTRSSFEWHVLEADAASAAQLRDNDLIFLADVRSASLPKEISDALAINIKDGGFAVQNAALNVIPEVLAGKAVVQALRSPWNFYKKAYVLLYDGEQGLAQLHALFAVRDNLYKLDGQLCVVGQDSKSVLVESFEIKAADVSEDEAPKTVQDYVRTAEEYTNLPIWTMALIALGIVILIIIMIGVIRRKHNEYKRAGEVSKKQQGFATDEETIKELVRRCVKPMYEHAMKITRDETRAREAVRKAMRELQDAVRHGSAPEDSDEWAIMLVERHCRK